MYMVPIAASRVIYFLCLLVLAKLLQWSLDIFSSHHRGLHHAFLPLPICTISTCRV